METAHPRLGDTERIGKTSGRRHPEGRPRSELAAQSLWRSFWHPQPARDRRDRALADPARRRALPQTAGRAWPDPGHLSRHHALRS